MSFIKGTILALIIASSIFYTLPTIAQDTLKIHQSTRFEVGLGPCLSNTGLSGRVAISYLKNKWGGLIRLTAHDGEKGNSSGWFGPPIEKIYDKAILVSYIPTQANKMQLITSAGVGIINGERLTATKNELENINSVLGVAWEIGLASTGSTIGGSLNLMGNVNPESNVIGFLFSVTIGSQK